MLQVQTLIPRKFLAVFCDILQWDAQFDPDQCRAAAGG
jgi:hypothetical protein